MTDQPKPNQPPVSPADAVEAKQAPKEVPPAADKAPVTDAKPAELDSKPVSSAGTTRIVEPPKPLGDAKPVVPAASVPAPQSPVPTPAAPAAPTQPTAPKPADPPAAISSAPAEKSVSSAPPVPAAPPPAEKQPASNATIPIPEPSGSKLPSTSMLPPAPDNKEDTILPQSNGGNKVTQRFSDLPAAAAAASAGTICPSCGHRNRPGTLMCDNCGTNLVGGSKTSIGTRNLVSAQSAIEANDAVLDQAQIKAIESAGGTVFTEDMVLRIEIEGGATPMLVYPKQEIILGRRDPNTGTLPDVDMTAYSGYRMGVSRTHASIRLQEKQLNLSDRGSSNGTFLNGTRLVAHRPYPVKDGDEIRLGQMVLKIYFQSNKGRK